MTRRTLVVEIDPHRPDPDVIGRAAALVRDGGLVAFPTETVYGLGVDATSPAAVRSVFEAKGRPSTDPLIVHLPAADDPMLARVARAWPDRAAELARRFWPGPLTMVLPRTDEVPPEVSAGLDTVAVRVPAHAVARALITAVGRPVAAPSANRFGRVSPTTALHVIEELDGRIDMILDAGPTPLGLESTVVDVTAAVPAVLRPGGVTLEDLEAELGEVHHAERRSVDADRAAHAPGQLLQHYSPNTPVVLVEGDEHLVDELRTALRAAGVTAAPLGLPSTPADAARELYAALRRGDELGAEVLLAPVLDPTGLGRAVNDRLFRSAHGRVVDDASRPSVARLVDLVR